MSSQIVPCPQQILVPGPRVKLDFSNCFPQLKIKTVSYSEMKTEIEKTIDARVAGAFDDILPDPGSHAK